MFKKRIYLDYASLTPVDPRVIREMKKFSAPIYANPSSLYAEGVAARKAMADGRKSVADFIRAHPDEIIFTSGGTEANGLALEGAGRTARRSGIEKPHLIISSIEHSSIIEVAKMMEKYGCEVTRLSVSSSGIVNLDELRKALKPSTYLVSIMTVNNEVGTIQPVREIAKIVRDYRKSKTGVAEKVAHYPLFHTDAAQAGLFEELNVEKLGVDLLTLDSSKMYGPRGMGCLYVKRNTPIEPIIYGGGQEKGLRSGTENIPAIMGFAKALELVGAELAKGVKGETVGKEHFSQVKCSISDMRAELIDGLRKIRPNITVNGAKSDNQSPHILNVSIPGIDNEFFVLQLDAKGISCSTKSSCLRDSEESYVLKAIGADSKTSVRFSFGRWTKKRDVKRALLALFSIFC